ncbi:prepilin peptidase [Serratia quinivorans]|uniref:prepilin peptidase n=1 Tax=Serratia quinivorans TaxID=137545 RepID=UPI003F9D6677
MNYWDVLLFIITAYAFQILALYSADRFIKTHEPRYGLSVQWCYAIIIPWFSVLAVLSMQNDTKFMNILFVSAFYGFLTLFIILDIERNWLPKCFTLTFIVVGVIYRAIEPESEWWVMIATLCILWLGLFLFRIYINRRAGGEVFGLGDVYLIVGLAVWFSGLTALKLITVATLLAILFLLFKKYRSPSRWRHHHEYRGAPFAPFLCGVAAVWGVLPVATFS